MSLTEIRRELAAGLQGALGDIPVYSVMPANVAAPCVLVIMRGAEQDSPKFWHQEYRIICVGPGGDNEAAVESLERLLQASAAFLSETYQQPAAWDAPGTVAIAGTSYLASFIEITIDISAD